MKIILYCVILVLIFLAPVSKQDIGDLEPVQAIWLRIDNGNVVLQTDTEDAGTGETVEAAIQAMKKNSEGVIYLDTAQFLLVSENALAHLEDIMSHLKASVKLCLWQGDDVASAARYMQSHDMGHKMKEFKAGKQLQTIPSIVKKEGT